MVSCEETFEPVWAVLKAYYQLDTASEVITFALDFTALGAELLEDP